MSELIYPEESYAVVGACFEVYNAMGCGFLESVYQECLRIEFMHQGIPFAEHPQLKLEYRGQRLKQSYSPDFTCYDKIIVEIKAATGLSNQNRAQVFNYLSATGYRLGMLVNFGAHPKLVYERIVSGCSGKNCE